MKLDTLLAIPRWALSEAREKLDLRTKWHEILETSKEWGPRFIVAAVIWELIEDVLFPFLSWWFGVPWLIPVFLIWHFEPVSYPVIFWMFRTWDRVNGKSPWEADRPAYSSHWRTALKVLIYRLTSIGGLLFLQHELALPHWLLGTYIVLMTLFNFAHERIWHDLNFGIDVQTDEVHPRRAIAKAATYRTVSVLLMGGAVFSLEGSAAYMPVLEYQALMALLYLSLETVWAKNTMGISTSGATE